MLNFLVDYVDRSGVEMHTTFQANAGHQHRQLAVAVICRLLNIRGCMPTMIASISGNHTLKELDRISEKGPSRHQLPMRITFEHIRAAK